MYPTIFQTSFFTLNTFWVFMVIAIITASYVAIKLSIKNSLKLNFLSNNLWNLIFWTLIGARIIHLIASYQSYFYEISINVFLGIFKIWDKGLNSWGAILGFAIYFYIICKKNNQDFFKWLDSLTPPIILGIAITNIGNFFEGANYGKETSMPWGVNFENPAIKYTVPIHPTQIYAAIYSIIIFFILLHLNKNKRIHEMKKTGIIGLTGIIIYQLARFIEEFFRGDDVLMIGPVRSSQILALIITISAGIFIYFRYNNSGKNLNNKTNA